MALIHNSIPKKTTKTLPAHWLVVGLAAAALTLSACGNQQQEGGTVAPDAETAESQTAIEGEPTNAPMATNAEITDTEDSAVLASDDASENTAVMTNNDDLTVTETELEDAGLEDDEILDGSESSEHISTY